MGKITKALKKIEQHRGFENVSVNCESLNGISRNKGGSVKNGWLLWVFIIGVVVTVFISFNYEGGKNVVPLSEIFPEDKGTNGVEYEFVEADAKEAPQKIVQKVKELVKSEPAKVSSAKPLIVNEAVVSPQIAKKEVKVESSNAVEVAKKEDTKLTFKNAGTSSSPLTEIGKAIKEAPNAIIDGKTEAKSQPVLGDGDYSIQLASFKQEASANLELEKLLKKDFPAFVKSMEIENKGTWYRVYVGRFDSKDDASNYLKNVKVSYKDSFIIKLK